MCCFYDVAAQRREQGCDDFIACMMRHDVVGEHRLARVLPLVSSAPEGCMGQSCVGAFVPGW